MAQHLPTPTQLAMDYDDLLIELKALIAPYLPENVRLLAVTRADGFKLALDDYASIDAVFRALRNNGMPGSHRHRAYKLMKDHIETRKARGDDPQAA